MTDEPKAVRFDDRTAFAARVMPFLMQREAENCFFVGFISGLDEKPDALMLCVENGGDVVAVALKTPGRHLLMTDAPPLAVDALVDHLLEAQTDPLGVQSRRETARRFAERYCSRTGRQHELHAAMAIHVLTQVTPVHGVAGRLRLAAEGDVELLAGWITEFCRECRLPAINDERQKARQGITRQETHLWELDGVPVSTASLSGPTPNGIRISLVYTPPEHRGRGYASACVATVSQRMLDAGRKFCFLYTDLANPASNKSYRNIGYERVCESDQILFC